MRRLICKAISDRFFLSLSLSHLRLYKYQMLIRRGMAALAAVRVQKLSSDAGGTRWDTVRWPSCAAQGLADPCIAGPSRGFADVPAESLCKILAARNSHLFCSYLRPALEIWTGERRAMWRGIMPAGWCTSGNKVSWGSQVLIPQGLPTLRMPPSHLCTMQLSPPPFTSWFPFVTVMGRSPFQPYPACSFVPNHAVTWHTDWQNL